MKFAKWMLMLCLYFIITHAGAATDRLSSSIALAQHFLIQQFEQGHDGLECTTIGKTRCPVSNTGKTIVGYYIQIALGDKLPASVAKKMLSRLSDERHHPKWLWGYTKGTMSDTDDTAYALQTLLQMKKPVQIRDFHDFLNSQHHAFKTFLNDKKIGLASLPSEENNDGLHLEVNANIFYLFHLLNHQDMINYDLIIKQQSPNGSWEGYFYPGNYFATFMSMRLLCASQKYQPVIKKGLDFLYQSQHKNGSWGTPYDTGLALNTLLSCSTANQNVIQKGVEYLLGTQEPQGDWSNKNSIWFFVYEEDPLTIWIADDNWHTLTTAINLMVLSLYQSRLNHQS